MSAKNLKISVIGAGNMGAAIINGLAKAGYKEITACDSDKTKLASLPNETKKSEVNVFSDITILAVKPGNIKEVLNQCPQNLNALVISVAAGIRTENIASLLPPTSRIVRVMPNLPALISKGCSAIYGKNKNDAELAEEIFSTIGQCHILEEEHLIDTATALCGSGPAFFALFIQATAQAAVKLGMKEEVAERMALETALGTSLFLAEQKISTKKLQEMVSSPGGTTLAGLKSFTDSDLLKVVSEALEAATKRAREIASQR